MIDSSAPASTPIVQAEGDPIEAERVRAEVKFRLFGGDKPVIRVGRFELGERLGIGGMGVVYAAHDRDLGRTVAIKVLFERTAGELRREAQALAKLRHPNVVSVHEIGTWQDLPFVAMELVDGHTLRAWLAERSRSWREIAAVFAGAGRGLAAAHAAGLVHRDFKLENVLVDREGQARVVDFGLARPSGDQLELSRAKATAAGTPAYMAPEVLRGEPATPRADQFSFGVALHEALTGERPFAGRTIGALISAIVVQPTLKIPNVPRSLAVVIERCLAAEPAERHASMTAIVAALEPKPAQRWPWIMVPAIAATVIGTALYLRPTDEPAPVADPCASAGAPIANAWNEQRRVAMRTAFDRTKLVFAGDAFASAVTGLDAYAQIWRTIATESCRASANRAQSDQITTLRATCLADRQQELAAVVVRFTEADERTVERAVAAVAALPPVESCADLGALADRTPLPKDPAVVERIGQARAKLAAARAALHAGNAKEAQASTAKLSAEVDAIAYAPLTAEVQLVLGSAAGTAADYAAAEPALERAYREGLAGRHDPAAADAAIKLAHLRGHVQAKLEDGKQWIANAEALLRRIGPAHELTAPLQNVIGNLEQTAGKYDLALAAFERAERAWRAAHGDHRVDIAITIRNTGNTLMLAGRGTEALAKLRAALALLVEALGPKHPHVAISTTALTGALRDLDRYAEALALDEKVLASELARVGPDHPDVAFVHGAIGNDLRGLGRHAEALARYEAARTIFLAKLGPDHPTVASSDHNIGTVLVALGRYAEAEPRFAAALAAKQKRGDRHPGLIRTLDAIGTVAMRRGRLADARRSFQRALEIAEAALGKDSPELADTLHGLGEVTLLEGDAKTARAILERAYAFRSSPPIGFTLGRAIYQLGERATGHRMVTEAQPALTDPYDREQARAWLARHGL